MILEYKDLRIICESLYDPNKDLIEIQNQSFKIFGKPAEEGKDQCRSSKIGSYIFAEQKLFKKGRTLGTTGAILRRSGYKAVWAYLFGTNTNWKLYIDGLLYNPQDFEFSK